MPRHAARITIGFALAWHALSLLVAIQKSVGQGIGDFASYYWAFRVAVGGGDPYSTTEITLLRGGAGVHPYFYPPPFLLLMVPFGWMPPKVAFAAWFLFDELCTAGVVAVLWVWWGRRGDVGPLVLIVTALCTAIANNHWMGQANIPVLLVALLGLWAEDEDHPWLGGALVGVACMCKMSPALFVLAWLVRGRWKPVASAVITAVVASVLALPLVGLSHQWAFYTQVLPGFSSGIYNGLTVPISLYGNHSIPNVFDAFLPSPVPGLSAGARIVSSFTALALTVGTLAVFAVRGSQNRFAEIGALGALMLLVPVFTYEHHVVWAIPALIVGWRAAAEGRLPAWAQVVLGVTAAIWAFELADLKLVSQTLRVPLLSPLVREAKFLAILALYTTNLAIAAGFSKEEP